MSNVLVTGGLGYIGSHIAVELSSGGHNICLYDNLSNSTISVLPRLRMITGREFQEVSDLSTLSKSSDSVAVVGDIRDKDDLIHVIEVLGIDTVIHCAGLKSVKESCDHPLKYYNNNLSGSVALLSAIDATSSVDTLIFSSSATVYGTPQELPLTESHPKGECTNPYGWTKSMVEQVFRDYVMATDSMKLVLLRYFNPVGSHQSGLIGEDPKELNNLVPLISQVAVGGKDHLEVYSGYDTPDGTGIRDYIHVVDLARGHTSVLSHIKYLSKISVFNLGTSKGYSVLDVVRTYEMVNQVEIPFELAGVRSGDVNELVADASKAQSLLGWDPEFSLEDMCRDAYNWQVANPEGYNY